MSVRRLGVLAASLSVVVAGLAASPTVAADKDAGEQSMPKLRPNKNTDKGGVSDTGVAIAKAKKSDKRVELVTERTATDTVFANPDGTLSRERASSPIRAKDADGKLAAIDTDLATRGERLVPKVATGAVSFSPDGAGQLASYAPAKGVTIGLGFDGDLGSPKVDGQTATYPVTGMAGAVLRASAAPDGFAADVRLSQRPEVAASGQDPNADDTAEPARSRMLHPLTWCSGSR